MAKRTRNFYRFGEAEFTSKDAARRYFAKIRESIGPGETITDPEHLRAVSDLLQGHVDREEKIGCGVKRFFVFYAPDHPNSTCFWLERQDGSQTDFGFFACIDSIGKLNRQSLRAVIYPQILAFRDARLAKCSATFISDYSGTEFPISEANIDHEIEFEEIVRQFAEREGIAIEKELLTTACDARSKPTWKDEALADRFAAFHSTFPLRLVSQRENLSDLRRRSTAAAG